VSSDDKTILRDLARRYAEICREPVQAERRQRWRRHNSLKPERPLLYVRAFAWSEMPQAQTLCADPFYRPFENHLRYQLFWHSLQDDSIFEPWLTVNAGHRCSGWGVTAERRYSGEARGSFKVDYPLKNLEDIAKLREPRHEIDEAQTARAADRLRETVGDILPVNVDRGPAYRMWGADLSTDLGYLRGIENIMLDMTDHPEWLHRLLAFMSTGVQQAQETAEQRGDWGLGNHQNQAMPYAEELADPAANVYGVKRRQLWCFMAAQEFTGVSPAMHEEFLLRYQMPILERFGLTAYGCCEDLTNKIGMLRQIPNLRRIAVAPAADVARCAEQIGGAYVLSYRPSPADMVSYDFNPERIRRILRRDLAICRANGCHADITLKDVETVQGDPDRIRRWVGLVRQVTDELYG
jgi:hypothetical protein